MKILVLVKHVPDATGDRGFSADHTVDREAADGLLSELDEYAVEQALQVAENGDDVEVVVLTVGPDDATDAIKRALQMGASAGIHVLDDAIAGLGRAGHQRDHGRGRPQGGARSGAVRDGVDRRRHGRRAGDGGRATGLACRDARRRASRWATGWSPYDATPTPPA